METHAGPKTVMLSFPVIRQFLASLWQGPFSPHHYGSMKCSYHQNLVRRLIGTEVFKL